MPWHRRSPRIGARSRTSTNRISFRSASCSAPPAAASPAASPTSTSATRSPPPAPSATCSAEALLHRQIAQVVCARPAEVSGGAATASGGLDDQDVRELPVVERLLMPFEPTQLVMDRLSIRDARHIGESHVEQRRPQRPLVVQKLMAPAAEGTIQLETTAPLIGL